MTAHLPLALTDEQHVDDRLLPVTLRLQYIGDLMLPSGRLVACDPASSPGLKPFSLPLPQGNFPVILSLAHLYYRDELDRIIYEEVPPIVAFSTIRIRQSVPVRWEIMTTDDQEITGSREGQEYGYGVDSGIGGFMDYAASQILHKQWYELVDPPVWETIMNGISETERSQNSSGWFQMSVGPANLIAFPSGEGSGIYTTYAGFDAEGEVAVIVTDFKIVRADNPTLCP